MKGLKKWTVGHSGFYGSGDDRFVKMPDGAIVVGPHTKMGKPFVRSRLFGLIPRWGQYNTPGIMYLFPREEEDQSSPGTRKSEED